MQEAAHAEYWVTIRYRKETAALHKHFPRPWRPTASVYLSSMAASEPLREEAEPPPLVNRVYIEQSRRRTHRTHIAQRLPYLTWG